MVEVAAAESAVMLLTTGTCLTLGAPSVTSSPSRVSFSLGGGLAVALHWKVMLLFSVGVNDGDNSTKFMTGIATNVLANETSPNTKRTQ
jgi:hypothetical protein